MLKNLQELYQYRALLFALTQRELSARYRASILGFLWTFLNPTLNMIVYVVVFGVLLQNQIPRYPFFLLTALLPWAMFSNSVVAGCTAISDRRDLLTKVHFPAQILPTTVVITNLVNFLLTLPLVFALGLLYSDIPSWHIVYVPLIATVQVGLTLGLTYILAALTVRYRDLLHIVTNVVSMAFFITPVLWDLSSVSPFHVDRLGISLTAEQTRNAILYVNPMATIVEAWRDVFYWHRAPPLRPLAIAAGLSLVIFWFAARLFERRKEEFAELI